MVPTGAPFGRVRLGSQVYLQQEWSRGRSKPARVSTQLRLTYVTDKDASKAGLHTKFFDESTKADVQQ
jgi:hypothetical protein